MFCFVTSVEYPDLEGKLSFPSFPIFVFKKRRQSGNDFVDTQGPKAREYVASQQRRVVDSGVYFGGIQARELFVLLPSGLEGHHTTIKVDVSPCAIVLLPKRRCFRAPPPTLV